MVCEMSSARAEPSKGDEEENKDNDANAGERKETAVNYAAAGARPKVYPVPTVSTTNRSGMFKLSHQFTGSTSTKIAHRQRNQSDSDGEEDAGGVDVACDYNYRAMLSAPRLASLSPGLPSSRGSGDAEADGDKDWDQGKASTVEIFAESEKGSPEDLQMRNDELIAKSLEWEEMNEPSTFGQANQDREYSYRKFFDLKRMEKLSGKALSLLESDLEKELSGKATGDVGTGTGFDNTNKQIQFTGSGGDRRLEMEGRLKCAYCGKAYEESFMETHHTQCIENPEVAEIRRHSKKAMETAAIDDWRSVPTPATQAEWKPLIPVRDLASRIPGQQGPEETAFPVGVWESPSESAGVGDDEALAAAASAMSGFRSSAFYDDSDDAMIPCEFCDTLFPVYAIEQHQTHCDVRN